MNCTLCNKAIENFKAKFNSLKISDTQSADICSDCVDKFLKWQQKILANLFPTKAAKKFGKD